MQILKKEIINQKNITGTMETSWHYLIRMVDMERCIYCTDYDKNLKYNSEEHVIPAGLGGISKLPRDYVSDAANNKFSKYELKAMRYSLLTGNRKKTWTRKKRESKC